MKKYVLTPIVEGHGEVHALPILLEEWFAFRNHHNVELPRDGPIRAAGKQSLTVSLDRNEELGIEHYVKIAYSGRPDAILVLLDADDHCPLALASKLLNRAIAVLPPHYPVGVVVANREYEAWFLAALPSTLFRSALLREKLSLQSRQFLVTWMSSPSRIANLASRRFSAFGTKKRSIRLLSRVRSLAPAARSRGWSAALARTESCSPNSTHCWLEHARCAAA
jgi:hypothetical protein